MGITTSAPLPKVEEKVPIFTQFPLPSTSRLTALDLYFPHYNPLMSLFYLGKMLTLKPFFLNPELYTSNLSLALLFASMKVINTIQWEKMLIILIPI